MSQQSAGRIGWLVHWFDQWRGLPRSERFSNDAWVDALAVEPREVEDLIAESLATKYLKSAVEQLPSRERQVLLLHVNSGLTYWEIAGRLGLAEQVVLSDLSRAYSQLCVDLSVDELR